MAGTITALKAQRKVQDRVNVYLDGEFAFGLALMHAIWLKIGQSLSDKEIEELQAADSVEKIAKRAIDFVAYRPRSVVEVRRRLKRAGADEETIEDVVRRLKTAGLLDDGAFSEQWVDSRLRNNPRSKRMLAWELRQRGVDTETIEHSLQDVSDDDAAFQAAQKRLPRVANLPRPEQKRKLMEYLARNGFDFETARQAAEQALNQEAE
jgi:regulatory protein